MPVLLLTLAAAVPAAVPAAGQQLETLGQAAAPHRLITYKTVGDVTLRLHIFDPPLIPEAALPPMMYPKPAIVFFFGGGWAGGSPKQFYPHAAYLAGRGMIAVAAEYRVRNTHGTTPVESVADAKSAVRYLRSHAADLGIDPGRIAAAGGSAGGHLAAAAATLPGFDEAEEDLSISSVPNAVVLFNPVLDLVPLTRLTNRFPGIAGLTAALSPVRHLTERTPPALIFHGTDDATVPFEQAEEFCAVLHRTGNICTVMAFEGKGHGFFNYGRDDNHAFVSTVRAMDRFLATLGYLSGRPSLPARDP